MELNLLNARTPEPLLCDQDTRTDSLRSSLDDDYYESHKCHVQIIDEPATATADIGPSRFDCGNVQQLGELVENLEQRGLSRSRWINVTGCSRRTMAEISRIYLGGHHILSVDQESRRLLGGPIRVGETQIIWLQSSVWFFARREMLWSSMRQVLFCIVVCLPHQHDKGTLLTNFTGPHRLASELSNDITTHILKAHWSGQNLLQDVWALGFAIIRIIIEQLDPAFDMLDPIDSIRESRLLPKFHQLPNILEKSNNLARLDRYLSSLEELVSFFTSAQELLEANSAGESASSSFQASRLRKKIQHEQRLCLTYMKQYETLVQSVISYTTTQITERLDSSRGIAEQFAKIGVFLAGLAGIIAPMSLLTSFYGMNVKEINPQSNVTLFDFWQLGVPCLLITTASVVSLGLRLLMRPHNAGAGRK